MNATRTMQAAHNRALTLKTFWPQLVLAWLFFGLVQAAHFHWYYEQSIGLSLKWGLRDWLLWLLVAGGFYHCLAKHFQAAGLTFMAVGGFVLLTVLAGALQILLIVTVDLLTDGISRPFWADFGHLYAKRWFQNILIFWVLWLLLHIVAKSKPAKVSSAKVPPQAQTDRLKITDGKQHIWLDPKSISKVEVTGNYLCFFTATGQHVTRGTMKEQAAVLSPHGFVRINRSCLVNQAFIESCERISPSQVSIKLKGGDRCYASRRYWQQAKSQLGC